MRRVFLCLSLTLVVFWLTASIFQLLRIGGAIFNSGIVLVVLLSLLFGRTHAMISGAFFGILQSLFLSHMLFVHSIILVLIAYLIDKISQNLLDENYLSPFIITMGSCIFYNVCYYLIAFLQRIAPPIQNILPKTIIEILYTTIVVAVLYFSLFKLVKGRKLGDYNA